MTTLPLFTPTADGTAYDIQPAGVLLLLANTVYGDPIDTPPAGRARAKSVVDAMLAAAQAGGYKQATSCTRCWRAMNHPPGLSS